MNLGYLLAGEVGVDPQYVILLRHSNKKIAALRRAKCDIEHDYTLVQPTNSKYDFYAVDKPMIQVVVVIVDDAVYAIYRITGVKRTGTTRSLTSPAYNQFDIEQGYKERDAKEFSAVKLDSKFLNRPVFGWTSPIVAVARYGGRLFDSVEVQGEVPQTVVLGETVGSAPRSPDNGSEATFIERRDALVSNLSLDSLEGMESNLIFWKQEILNDADEVAQFMYRGGPWPPQASAIRLQHEDKRPEKMYWTYVKEEMHTFLCKDEERYRELWNRIGEVEKQSTTAVVGAVAAYLGEKVGVPAGVLGGFVAVGLYCLLKLGKESYCRYTEERTYPQDVL